ncbi:MAG: cobyrinate a,c-diamide synthase [Acidaminococcaceae bacterium]
MDFSAPRFMITATNSGSGKTTITCAVLKALLNQGLNTAAFKAGPDYIDPMFHSRVVGTKSRNLDLFMLGENICRYLLAKNSKNCDIAVLEGVMGYYDGISTTTAGSAYALAKETKTPVVLVINAAGASLSLAALIQGFKNFRTDSNIRGAILNNISPMTYTYYKDIIEKETGIKLLGYMPKMADCCFESRHLGLITAEEINNLQLIVDRLAKQAEKTIDLKSLIEIANTAPLLQYELPSVRKVASVKIGIAQDKAFCFYYQDSLDLLCEMGAELVPFSPLNDAEVPADCDGIILGGGYPEIYARELAKNESMLASIKKFILAKKPCFAECGGFMYLLDKYTDRDGKTWNWVGAITGEVSMTNKLKRFGYITLEAKNDNMLAKKGEKINGHEFHYSDSTNNGYVFSAKKPLSDVNWECINADESFFAGYPHVHLYGNINFAINFIRACHNKKD